MRFDRAGTSLDRDVAATDSVSVNRWHVLVVEDHEINMMIIQSYLEDAGVTMTCVTNGLEAYDAVKNADAGEYDIIFMDIQMPVMNGYEATRLIRNLDSEYAKNVPIYALTANACEEDVKKALDCGMNGHIAKPIRKDTIIDIIKCNIIR